MGGYILTVQVTMGEYIPRGCYEWIYRIAGNFRGT